MQCISIIFIRIVIINMRCTLVSTREAVERVIECSCKYDVSQDAPSMHTQQVFFVLLKFNQYILQLALDYLEGRTDYMPQFVGLRMVS